jgi:hypothetical protein
VIKDEDHEAAVAAVRLEVQEVTGDLIEVSDRALRWIGDTSALLRRVREHLPEGELRREIDWHLDTVEEVRDAVAR